ncbi:MAG: ApaG domain [Spirochaeta sp.]|nr:ApaG domain [Spirochaeta sp.]
MKSSVHRVLVTLLCGLVFLSADVVAISAEEVEESVEPSESVRVRIDTEFLEEESSAQGFYVWQYTVALTNQTNLDLILTGRRWLFFDEEARLHVAEDDWLEGDEPRIPPARTFRYTTIAELETPSGSMSGSFFFLTPDGQELEVEIETVELEVPEDNAGGQ